jgi:Cof subfamily protein (haloacid dehalogenase superfamily)
MESAMMYQLVAIDIDGTLLNSEHRISARTKRAVQHIQEAGLKVILASGRGPRSVDPFIEELMLADAVITHNGAVIYEKNPASARQEIGFQAKELEQLINYCREKKVHFDLNTAFDVYVEQLSEEAKKIYARFFMEPSVVEDASLVKQTIVKFTISGVEKQIDEVYEQISPRFPGWSIIRSGETFIDVIHPRATKANALQLLLQEYGIRPQQVVAFGNYFNDIEMLEMSGLGVAMDNAPQAVKDKADRVTASNDEDGVAIVLEELLEHMVAPPAK